MTDPTLPAADPAPQADDFDGIPILTDREEASAEMVVEISRRIETRLAAILPGLIEATVREYLAEQTTPPAPGRE